MATSDQALKLAFEGQLARPFDTKEVSTAGTALKKSGALAQGPISESHFFSRGSRMQNQTKTQEQSQKPGTQAETMSHTMGATRTIRKGQTNVNSHNTI